jgi:hypothetical protein
MKGLIFVILLVTILSVYGLPKPGVIRPVIDGLGDVHLKVPRGGAMVQPVSPINNTEEVEMTFVIDGQAVELNDPLIFFYSALLDSESGSVILNFPTDTFWIHGTCGARITAADVVTYGAFNLHMYWDGQYFTNDLIPETCA